MSDGDTATSAAPAHPWVVEGRRSVRFGIFGGPWSDWPALRDFVQLAEALGLDAYWMADHPLRYPGCWTQLAALAVSTRRLRLGSLVANTGYRHPALLARQAADVDRLSGGRLVLGLGTGDNAGEHQELGQVMPPLAERQEALADTVTIVRGLWGSQPFSYRGRRYQVAAARVTPGPVQQPWVPILIAGGGERVTLRQVAQHGDAANVGPGLTAGSIYAPADDRRKVVALRDHCLALGRPFAAVLRTGWTGYVLAAETEAAARAKLARLPLQVRRDWAASLVVGTPPRLVDHYQARVDAGIQYFTAAIYENDTETVRLLAEQVQPRLMPRSWT